MLKTFLKFCVYSFLISLGWGVVEYLVPVLDFPCSPPPRCPVQQNTIALGEHGNFLERFAKPYRPRSRFELGPGLWAGPIAFQFTGWNVIRRDVCFRGTITLIEGIQSDGDVNFTIAPLPEFRDLLHGLYREYYAAYVNSILVEIDDPLRKNFPIVSDLRVGDTLVLCGSLVQDRGHDRDEDGTDFTGIELHPPSWIEIVEPLRACSP